MLILPTSEIFALTLVAAVNWPFAGVCNGCGRPGRKILSNPVFYCDIVIAANGNLTERLGNDFDFTTKLSAIKLSAVTAFSANPENTVMDFGNHFFDSVAVKSD